MRLDKFLKVSRIIKRRTVANEACSGGRVSLNGKVAKPGAEVREGDVLILEYGMWRIDEDETAARRERIEKKLESLWED